MNDLQNIYFQGVDAPRPAARLASLPRFPRAVREPKPFPEANAPSTLVLPEFIEWLLQHAGLNAAAYRPNALARRLPACLRRLGVPSPAAAKLLLQKKPELLPAALDSVLIGVTEFFRDRGVFEALRERILPEWRRQPDGLRVYSAGTANGQELYSIAMLLADAQALDRADLLGLDCRPEAVASARRGSFPESALDPLEPILRDRFFDVRAGRATVKAQLRSKVRWELGDISAYREDRPWDMILCRNVTIYLTPGGGTAMMEHLGRQLAPGGCLVTGKAERPPPHLALVRIAPCLYRKRM